MQQLDPRYIRLERVVGFIVTAVIAIVAAVVLAFVENELERTWFASAGVAAAVLVGGAALLAYAWPPREYRHAGYELDRDAIEIRGGVMWRHVRKVPRSRVQHTDVTQGPLERRFGLATLVIHTAGTEHAQVTLAGLAHDTALALRDRLLPHEHADAV